MNISTSVMFIAAASWWLIEFVYWVVQVCSGHRQQREEVQGEIKVIYTL